MNEEPQTPVRKRQPNRRITPSLVSRFKAEVAVQGNGTRAVEVLEPEYGSGAKDRAYAIAKKVEEIGIGEYLDKRVDEIAAEAIERVGDIVNSTDEQVALSASKFVIEQKRGKAVQKNENKNVNINIQSVLE